MVWWPALTISSPQCYFMFACTWSLGASLDSKGRKHFNSLFRELMSDGLSLESKRRYKILIMVDAPTKQHATPIPEDGSVFEFQFVSEVKHAHLKYIDRFLQHILSVIFRGFQGC